jgi:hypothetical protein
LLRYPRASCSTPKRKRPKPTTLAPSRQTWDSGAQLCPFDVIAKTGPVAPSRELLDRQPNRSRNAHADRSCRSRCPRTQVRDMEDRRVEQVGDERVVERVDDAPAAALADDESEVPSTPNWCETAEPSISRASASSLRSRWSVRVSQRCPQVDRRGVRPLPGASVARGLVVVGLSEEVDSNEASRSRVVYAAVAARGCDVRSGRARHHQSRKSQLSPSIVPLGWATVLTHDEPEPDAVASGFTFGLRQRGFLVPEHLASVEKGRDAVRPPGQAPGRRKDRA